MIATETIQQEISFLSEIFPLTSSQPPNLSCFRLIPQVEQEDGNRLSFHFCQKFPNRLVVTWHQNNFWMLAQPNQPMPSLNEWQTALESIQDEVEDFSNCFWQFQEVPLTLVVPPPVFSKLAVQILKTTRPYPFLSPIALSKKGVEVRRDVKFWENLSN